LVSSGAPLLEVATGQKRQPLHVHIRQQQLLASRNLAEDVA